MGRERDIAELATLLAQARLVTVIGPGGSGKTRLALELAALLAGQGDVAVVELAALSEPDLVPAAIAGALGLGTGSVEPALGRVTRALTDRRTLLVLDNLEQLVGAGPMIAGLLQACPMLRVVATSRVPLNIDAERRFPLAPLPVPPVDAPLEALIAEPSVALLAERAKAVDPRFEVQPGNAADLAAICRRLDGLPLAIELAAARLRLLSPSALLARLDHPLDVLNGGPVDAPDRHRTLRDTIAWSVSLLPAAAAALFPRLGVFSGGFDLRAAFAVAAPGIVDTEDGLLDLLGVLVDHSLLCVSPGMDDEPRFRMLETIRQHAEATLVDDRPLRGLHLDHYLRLAEDAEAALDGPVHARFARLLTSDTENLRAASRWAESTRSVDRSLRLARALAAAWRMQGDLREARERLERAIAMAGSGSITELSTARVRLATLDMEIGDRTAATRLYRCVLETSGPACDPRRRAEALLGLSMATAEEGRLEDAFALAEQALVAGRGVNHAPTVSQALYLLGAFHGFQADHVRARSCFEDAITVAREAGDRRHQGIAMVDLADCLLSTGNAQEALALVNAGIDALREVEARTYLAWATLVRALALIELRDLASAREAVTEAMGADRHETPPNDRIFGLEVAAYWLGAAGLGSEALVAWGAASAARSWLDLPLQPSDRAWTRRGQNLARRLAGEPRASLAQVQGGAMSLDDALAQVLTDLTATSLATRPPSRVTLRGGDLTTRETEVLALVGEGCSDGEIAERLSISKKTASVHVANIKGKLGTANRVETALAAQRLGLVAARTCASCPGAGS